MTRRYISPHAWVLCPLLYVLHNKMCHLRSLLVQGVCIAKPLIHYTYFSVDQIKQLLWKNLHRHSVLFITLNLKSFLSSNIWVSFFWRCHYMQGILQSSENFHHKKVSHSPYDNHKETLALYCLYATFIPKIQFINSFISLLYTTYSLAELMKVKSKRIQVALTS